MGGAHPLDRSELEGINAIVYATGWCARELNEKFPEVRKNQNILKRTIGLTECQKEGAIRKGNIGVELLRIDVAEKLDNLGFVDISSEPWT